MPWPSCLLRVGGQAAGSRRRGEPCVEGCHRRCPSRRRERQVKGISGAQPSRWIHQEVVLGAAVHLTSQLDAMVHTLVEASEDRLVESSRNFPRNRPLVEAAGGCRHDLRYREVGDENVIAALDDVVELFAAWLGQKELQKCARITVEGTRQPGAVCGALLVEPRWRASSRGDRRGPRRRWRTTGGRAPASCDGTARDSVRPCRAGGPAAPALRRVDPSP